MHQPATFAEIEAARRAPGATCSDGANHPWQLATILSIAAIAAEQDQGVAFGWNLNPGGLPHPLGQARRPTADHWRGPPLATALPGQHLRRRQPIDRPVLAFNLVDPVRRTERSE
jgi:hypothetical protein